QAAVRFGESVAGRRAKRRLLSAGEWLVAESKSNTARRRNTNGDAGTDQGAVRLKPAAAHRPEPAALRTMPRRSATRFDLEARQPADRRAQSPGAASITAPGGP